MPKVSYPRTHETWLSLASKTSQDVVCSGRRVIKVFRGSGDWKYLWLYGGVKKHGRWDTMVHHFVSWYKSTGGEEIKWVLFRVYMLLHLQPWYGIDWLNNWLFYYYRHSQFPGTCIVYQQGHAIQLEALHTQFLHSRSPWSKLAYKLLTYSKRGRGERSTLTPSEAMLWASLPHLFLWVGICGRRWDAESGLPIQHLLAWCFKLCQTTRLE